MTHSLFKLVHRLHSLPTCSASCEMPAPTKRKTLTSFRRSTPTAASRVASVSDLIELWSSISAHASPTTGTREHTGTMSTYLLQLSSLAYNRRLACTILDWAECDEIDGGKLGSEHSTCMRWSCQFVYVRLSLSALNPLVRVIVGFYCGLACKVLCLVVLSSVTFKVVQELCVLKSTLKDG